MKPRAPYAARRSGGCRPPADDSAERGGHDRRMSSTEFRARLFKLTAERLDAQDAGLARDPAYMADLEGEVAACRVAFTLAAVTEIASLRGELCGRDMG